MPDDAMMDDMNCLCISPPQSGPPSFVRRLHHFDIAENLLQEDEDLLHKDEELPSFNRDKKCRENTLQVSRNPELVFT